jgi:hypothetical protein
MNNLLLNQTNIYWTLPHARQTLGMTDMNMQEVYGIYYFRFGPHDVIHKLKDKGKVLGLVIDVNYSDRYYHKGVGIFVIL